VVKGLYLFDDVVFFLLAVSVSGFMDSGKFLLESQDAGNLWHAFAFLI